MLLVLMPGGQWCGLAIWRWVWAGLLPAGRAGLPASCRPDVVVLYSFTDECFYIHSCPILLVQAFFLLLVKMLLGV